MGAVGSGGERGESTYKKKEGDVRKVKTYRSKGSKWISRVSKGVGRIVR